MDRMREVILRSLRSISKRSLLDDTKAISIPEKKEEIYSDKYIRIEQEDKTITGYGFESNQELTEYQIRNTTGIFTVEDNSATMNTTPKDSISSDSTQVQPQRIQPIRKR